MIMGAISVLAEVMGGVTLISSSFKVDNYDLLLWVTTNGVVGSVPSTVIVDEVTWSTSANVGVVVAVPKTRTKLVEMVAVAEVVVSKSCERMVGTCSVAGASKVVDSAGAESLIMIGTKIELGAEPEAELGAEPEARTLSRRGLTSTTDAWTEAVTVEVDVGTEIRTMLESWTTSTADAETEARSSEGWGKYPSLVELCLTKPID